MSKWCFVVKIGIPLMHQRWTLWVFLSPSQLRAYTQLQIAGLYPSAYWAGQALVDLPLFFSILVLMLGSLFAFHYGIYFYAGKFMAVVSVVGQSTYGCAVSIHRKSTIEAHGAEASTCLLQNHFYLWKKNLVSGYLRGMGFHSDPEQSRALKYRAFQGSAASLFALSDHCTAVSGTRLPTRLQWLWTQSSSAMNCSVWLSGESSKSSCCLHSEWVRLISQL